MTCRRACTRWWLIALCACGRVAFEPRADATVPIDGPGAFGTPHQIPELESVMSDIVPSLRADQLEIIFGSLRPPSVGAYQLWDATRSASDQPFSGLHELMIAGTTAGSEPALSDDGLQMFFRRNGSELVFTDRATLADAWAPATVATELIGFTGCDYIGDLRMVMSDAANGALFETTRADRHAAWVAPTRIDELMIPGVRTEYPTASADGLELIFQTNTGVLQLAHAFRTAIGQPFGPVIPIDVGFPAVNVGDAELTHDGHTLYFTVENIPNDYNLYVMTR